MATRVQIRETYSLESTFVLLDDVWVHGKVRLEIRLESIDLILDKHHSPTLLFLLRVRTRDVSGREKRIVALAESMTNDGHGVELSLHLWRRASEGFFRLGQQASDDFLCLINESFT